MQVYPYGKILVVELLGQREYEFVISIGIIKFPS